MKKIIFPILAAAMLMSFVRVDSESALKVKAKKQVKSQTCHYVVSSGGDVTVTISTGTVISTSQPFSTVIGVPFDLENNQPVTPTIQTSSPYTEVRINGTRVTCTAGFTTVQFLTLAFLRGEVAEINHDFQLFSYDIAFQSHKCFFKNTCDFFYKHEYNYNG